MIKIEVKRTPNESSSTVLRRFTKRVQSSGILRNARAHRYATRLESPLKRKQSALKRLAKGVEYHRLRKLGKIKDVVYKKSN